MMMILLRSSAPIRYACIPLAMSFTAAFCANRTHHHNAAALTSWSISSVHVGIFDKNVFLLLFYHSLVSWGGGREDMSISTSINLTIAKVVSALLLWLCSLLGVLAPKISLAGDVGGGGGSAEPASAHQFLSLLDCCSAGLLIGLALFHFYSECVLGALCAVTTNYTNVSIPSSSSHGGSPSSPITTIPLLITSQHFAALVVIVGILFPLVVERALWGGGGTRAAGHSHSHGAAQNSSNSGSDSSEMIASTAATLAAAPSRSPVVTKIFDDSGGAEVKPSCAHPRSGSNPVLLIAALLSAHSTIEGAALGAEPSMTSLRAAMVPMALHKFFDGLIFGVRLAKQESGTTQPRQRWCSNPLVLGFVAVTPLAMLVSALVCSGFCSTAAADSSSSSCSGGFASAWLQGITAGSFLYIALAEILHEEMSNSRLRSGKGNTIVKIAAIALGAALSWTL